MNEEEHKAYHRRLIYVFVELAILFFGGAYFYHRVEGWRMLDSMYYAATTMTTVGYGDFSPKTDIGKIFSIFYLFTSVGLALYGLSNLAAHFVELREDDWVKRLDIVRQNKHAKNFTGIFTRLFPQKQKPEEEDED